MNLKQAKALRAGLKEFAKLANPERAAEYTQTEHWKVNSDGDRFLAAITAVLSPTCPRGLYQRAKRGIKNGGLDFKSGGLHRNRLRARVNDIVGDKSTALRLGQAGGFPKLTGSASTPIVGIRPTGVIIDDAGSQT
jgi:hypothetical protein